MTREDAIRRLEEILAVAKAELKQFELSHHPMLVEPTNRDMEAYEMAISALRAQQEQESNDRLQSAMNRLGEFGKLFVEYKGCPRGAIGRACVPLEEEVFAMPEIEDIDGGRWVPVNSDALRELVNQYKRMMTREERNDPLTMDELREMDGEPVWVRFIGGAIIRDDGWFVIAEIGTSEILIKGKVSVYKSLWYYGETWLAYRRKPEEGTV